jgi:hypothetical protein
LSRPIIDDFIAHQLWRLVYDEGSPVPPEMLE